MKAGILEERILKAKIAKARILKNRTRHLAACALETLLEPLSALVPAPALSPALSPVLAAVLALLLALGWAESAPGLLAQESLGLESLGLESLGLKSLGLENQDQPPVTARKASPIPGGPESWTAPWESHISCRTNALGPATEQLVYDPKWRTYINVGQWVNGRAGEFATHFMDCLDDSGKRVESHLILAPADGVVPKDKGWDNSCPPFGSSSDVCGDGGFGNHVKIVTFDGYLITMAHMAAL